MPTKRQKRHFTKLFSQRFEDPDNTYIQTDKPRNSKSRKIKNFNSFKTELSNYLIDNTTPCPEKRCHLIFLP